MEPARRRQLTDLSAAREELLAWARVHAIPLVHVESVVSFGADFSVTIWLFYDTDASVADCAGSGTTADVQERFLRILADNGYPAGWLAETSFMVDSHENVERNFEGSYFYRLR